MNDEERNHMNNLGVDGRKILILILKENCRTSWAGFNFSNKPLIWSV
jgi:hypothetical protein